MLNNIFACLKISFKRMLQYRFESFMILIYALFNFSFILLFWTSVSTVFILPNTYTKVDIYLFSALVMFSSAINEIFFCNNCLPYDINDGTLDTFLIRPGNKIVLYIANNINIASLTSNLLISIIFCVIALIVGRYNVLNFLIGVVLIIIGVLDFAILSAIIAMATFWYGLVDGFRNLFFSFEEIKKYPMGMFPNVIRLIFTVIIPLSLITYYPFEISIGRLSLTIKIILIYLLITCILIIAFKIIYSKGLKHYESNN